MHLCKLSVGLEKLNINLIKMSVLENNDNYCFVVSMCPSSYSMDALGRLIST